MSEPLVLGLVVGKGILKVTAAALCRHLSATTDKTQRVLRPLPPSP